MFDYLHVHQDHLPFIPELNEKNLKITNFQTKNLDCCLYDYYIDSIGDLYFDDVEYEIIENTNPLKEGSWNPLFFTEEKSRKRVKYPFTGTVLGTELINPSDPESFDGWIQVEFTFLKGSLVEPAKVKDLKLTPVKERLERSEKWKAINKKRDEDPIYGLTRWLFRLLSKVSNRIRKIQDYLLKYDVINIYEQEKSKK